MRLMNMSSILDNDLNEIFERSEDDAKLLLQRRVLVTGGSGFVGRWLIMALLHAAQRLRIEPQIASINRTTTAWQVPLAENRQLNVINSDVTNSIAVDNRFDYVFHCATPASSLLNETNPSEMKRVIEIGAENVIEYLAGSSTRVVNVSSGAVYGVQPSDVGCLDDEWFGDARYVLPNSAYHHAKVAAERRFNTAHRDSALDVVHARLFAFVAPFLPLNRHFAAGNFLKDALAGEPVMITGDGRTIRTYMYGTDLVVWLFAAAVRGVSGSAYNIGSPYEITIEELATRISQISGSGAGVRNLGEPDLAQSAHRYVPCTTRTENALGVHLEIGLDTAIDRTLRWLRNSPK